MLCSTPFWKKYSWGRKPGISSSASKRGPYKAFAFSLSDRTLLNDTFVENFTVETVKSLRFGLYGLVFVSPPNPLMEYVYLYVISRPHFPSVGDVTTLYACAVWDVWQRWLFKAALTSRWLHDGFPRLP